MTLLSPSLFRPPPPATYSEVTQLTRAVSLLRGYSASAPVFPALPTLPNPFSEDIQQIHPLGCSPWYYLPFTLSLLHFQGMLSPSSGVHSCYSALSLVRYLEVA